MLNLTSDQRNANENNDLLPQYLLSNIYSHCGQAYWRINTLIPTGGNVDGCNLVENRCLNPLTQSSYFEEFILKSEIPIKYMCEDTHCGFIYLS